MIPKSCRLFEQDHATEQALSQSCGAMAMGVFAQAPLRRPRSFDGLFLPRIVALFTPV